MLTGDVARERPPAAADVEDALPGLELELVGGDRELDLLGLLERGAGGRPGEERARVRHRRVEEQREEVVGDVVVVAHRAGVAGDGVPAPARAQLGGRRGGRPGQADRAGGGGHEPQAAAPVHRGRRPAVQERQRGVDVVDAQRPGDVGPADAELAGGAQRVGDGLGRVDREDGAARLGTAAVAVGAPVGGGRGGGQDGAVPPADLEGPVGDGLGDGLAEGFGSGEHRLILGRSRRDRRPGGRRGRRRGGRRGRGPGHPPRSVALDLLLPDRGRRLEGVDDLAAAGEGLARGAGR